MGKYDDEVLENAIGVMETTHKIYEEGGEVVSVFEKIKLDFLKELKEYRSICDSTEKLKLIDELYLERCEEINRLKVELEEYKKLEEEELLLKLPCKFGTKIYWLRPNAKGIPAEVMEHKFDCVMIDSIDLFGRVIFLTREEAKQALKRMKEVQDVN